MGRVQPGGGDGPTDGEARLRRAGLRVGLLLPLPLLLLHPDVARAGLRSRAALLGRGHRGRHSGQKRDEVSESWRHELSAAGGGSMERSARDLASCRRLAWPRRCSGQRRRARPSSRNVPAGGPAAARSTAAHGPRRGGPRHIVQAPSVGARGSTRIAAPPSSACRAAWSGKSTPHGGEAPTRGARGATSPGRGVTAHNASPLRHPRPRWLRVARRVRRESA